MTFPIVTFDLQAQNKLYDTAAETGSQRETI